MASADIINSVLKRGAANGIESLTASERKVWLISEAEVLCDMEGIDSFLDRYESLEKGSVPVLTNFRCPP